MILIDIDKVFGPADNSLVFEEFFARFQETYMVGGTADGSVATMEAVSDSNISSAPAFNSVC